MLTEELKEKRQKVLEEVQQELDRLAQGHQEPLLQVKEHVSEALAALQNGKYDDAWWHLLSGYNRLAFRKDALSILDLGIFAYRLYGSFVQLHDVVSYLWEKRKEFYPHLADALKATYWFRCLIEAGHKPEDAQSRALGVQHELYEMFGYGNSTPFTRDISNVLPPVALAMLKQILLDIYGERLSNR
jgi:hypothetical protein